MTKNDRTWRRQLQAQQLVDAEDTAKEWCEARVIEAKSHKVNIHYRGWTSQFNEWISRESPRLAPAYTKVKQWRALKKGNYIEVATEVQGRQKPQWGRAVVTLVRGPTDPSTAIPARIRVQMEKDGEMREIDPRDDCICEPGTHLTALPTKTRSGANAVSSDGESSPPRCRDLSGSSSADTGDEEAVDSHDEEFSLQVDKDGDHLPIWRLHLRPGELVDIADATPTAAKPVWFEGRVVQERQTEDGARELCVRYRGWPWRYDEWVAIDSERLDPTGTHFGPWRDFTRLQRVQVGFRAKASDESASHWREGTVAKFRVTKHTNRVKEIQVDLPADAKLGYSDMSVWRDVDDDFLAPIGMPTHPLKKQAAVSKKATSPRPNSGRDDGENDWELLVESDEDEQLKAEDGGAKDEEASRLQQYDAEILEVLSRAKDEVEAIMKKRQGQASGSGKRTRVDADAAASKTRKKKATGKAAAGWPV